MAKKPNQTPFEEIKETLTKPAYDILRGGDSHSIGVLKDSLQCLLMLKQLEGGK